MCHQHQGREKVVGEAEKEGKRGGREREVGGDRHGKEVEKEEKGKNRKRKKREGIA